MISVNTFITDTLNTVDAVIGNFVGMVYSNFVQANTGMITLMFTVYVMFIGYQFLSHKHHFNMSVIIRQLVVMLCVYGMVMNWKLYHLFVYNIFTQEPGNIAQILVNQTGQAQAGGSIAQRLDTLFLAVTNASMELFSQINFSVAGLAFIVYGILVYVIGNLMCVFALLLFVYSKMMMAVLLALGPIFILFILWEATRGLFSAWLNVLITIAFIPIVTSAILVLMLSVIHITLPNMQVPANELQFYGIAPFLGLTLATTMMLAQVFKICSTLGGGITLASISTGANIAGSAMKYSGLTMAGRAAANWTNRHASQVKNKMQRGSKQ